MDRQTYDHEKVSFNLARLKKGGEHFEIVVDPDLAVSFKEGQDIPIKDILKGEKIFSDAKKGQLASEARRLARETPEHLGAMLAHCTKGDGIYELILAAMHVQSRAVSRETYTHY